MLLVLVDLFLAGNLTKNINILKRTCFIFKITISTGAETTSSTLQWAMLYMITYPDVQVKVQEEIDAVIGSSRVPTLEDRPRYGLIRSIYTDLLTNWSYLSTH